MTVRDCAATQACRRSSSAEQPHQQGLADRR
ncbi:hypothetical protein ABIF05_000109, partial [Bradyrhizobium elkanii]